MSKYVRRGQVLPADAWYCAGSVATLPTRQEVLAHSAELMAKGALDSIGPLEPHSGGRAMRRGAGAFEARWTTQSGATVRARLVLEDGRAPGHTELGGGALTPGTVTIVAVADQEWDFAWPSPAQKFLRRGLVWGPSIGMEYLGANGIPRYHPRAVDVALEELHQLPWCTVVITHEPRPFDIAEGDRGAPPLARLMPAGLLGRVTELRVFGGDCTTADRHLQQRGLSLAWGGATIVMPDQQRSDAGIPRSELCIRSVPEVLNGGARQLLAEVLCRVAATPSPVNNRVRADLEDLRASWPGDDAPEPGPRKTDQPEGAARNEEVRVLAARLREAEERLAEQQRRHAEEQEELRQELSEVALARELRELHEELDGCERSLVAADALLDDQARRISWLQRELAKSGRPYGEDLVQDDSAPTSWEALFAAVGSLSYVAMSDVDDHVAALRGHALEATWLRRTWEALRALNAYAQTKAARGVDQVPHFAAYLQLADAEVMIPAARYCPAESGPVMANRRLREARAFPIQRGGRDRAGRDERAHPDRQRASAGAKAVLLR
jgi:hypothetical protein